MRKLASETGTALVMAVGVMFAMVTIGLATYTYTDTQTKTSTAERQRESTFNYSESLLGQGVLLVTTGWGKAGGFSDCTYSGGVVTPATSCPDASTLSQAFQGVDYSRGVTWTLKIRDNSGSGGSQFYDDASELTQPHYDANGDGEVWVRAQAVVNGKPRTQVERVRVTRVPIDVPHTVLSAGQVYFAGSKKLKVTAGTGSVLVRCSSSTPSSCVHQRSTNNDQISPTGKISYTGSTSVLGASGQSALLQRAIQENHEYDACPVNPPGQLVYIHNTAGATCGPSVLPPTSQTNPGLVVLENGSLNLSGSNGFWGVIYILNGNFTSNGLHDWHGSINVDGSGTLTLGTSTNTSLTFDDSVFNALFSYGEAQVIRPSFREISTQAP